MGLYRDSHAGDQRLANEVDSLIMKAGNYGNPVNLVAERVKFINDVARCRSCNASGQECDRIRKARDGAVGCRVSDWLTTCQHVKDRTMVDRLMREIMAGEVRTVAEAYPPPVQGPKLPGYAWLLDQDTWWYPHRRPAVRVASMDKPWRYNTVRFLERKAAGLHADVGSRHMHDAPDSVWASWQAENPLEWLRETPLMRAMGRRLPHPDTAKGRALAARAIHWHTCPMRLAHPGARDRCVCVRDGSGRIIGATNDPAMAALSG